MKKPSRAAALTAVSLFLALAAAVDCSRRASAATLEVTYYYLPG